MKNCRDCEHFNGYDYSDGTPICDYDEGYETCPYCDSAEIRNNGIKIEIDSGFMRDYIHHTLKNTIEREARAIAETEVKAIITEELKKQVLDEIGTQAREVVEESISDFMGKEITVGGGWSEPERKLTREEYLSETIEKELKDKFKSDAIKSYAKRETETAINKYNRKLKDEINAGINSYFNEVTRQTLTENIVSMLMHNDTYKKLADSMQTFLP